MKIGLNNSLLASRNLASTSQAIARALERLSTGQRVSSPQDGIVDYLTTERLDGQIRGLAAATQNVNQAYGLAVTVDSAIKSQLDIIAKIRELVLQGTTDLNDDSTTESLNSTIQGLLQEFNRITETTRFHDINLLDGSTQDLLVQVGPRAEDQIDISLFDHSSDFFSREITLPQEEVTIAGDGTFQTRATHHSTDHQEAVDLGDFDGDGDLDMFHGQAVSLGNGDGSFQAAQAVFSFNPYEVQLADVNNDGNLDLVASRYQISIRLGNGDGTFAAETTVSSSGQKRHFDFADLDDDGNLDMVTGGDTGIKGYQVFLGNGDGTFALTSTRFFGSAHGRVELEDLNGDGTEEMIIGNSAAIQVLEGNGDGTFGAQLLLDGDAKGRGIARDLDDDGNLDLIFTDSDDGDARVFVRLGNGDGTFGSKATFTTGNSPIDVDTADFNGDGFLDLITVNQNDDTISILFGNGDGSFESMQSFATEDFPKGLVLADLDENGATDILVAARNSDDVSIFLGNAEEVAPPTIDVTRSDIEISGSLDSSELLSYLEELEQSLISHRGEISVDIQRLDRIRSQNLVLEETTREARSSLAEVDFARETAELVRQQVLQQAQVAVQAQANVQLQIVLGLFDFN